MASSKKPSVHIRSAGGVKDKRDTGNANSNGSAPTPSTSTKMKRPSPSRTKDDPGGTGGSSANANELVCHGIFLRLDPIIRPLVSMVQLTHRPGQAQSPSETTKMEQPQPPDKILIQTLQTEIIMLQRVREALAAFTGSRTTRKELRDIQSSVMSMWNYILLPCLFMFKQSTSNLATTHHDNVVQAYANTSTNNETIRLAKRSLYLRCLEEAALVMAAFYDMLAEQPEERQNAVSFGSHENTENMIRQCFIAVASALPVEAEEPPSGPKPLAKHTSVAAGKSKERDASSEALDRQEHSSHALLRCIRSMSHFVAFWREDATGASTSNRKRGRFDIDQEMNGALVARLTQYCLQILTNSTCTNYNTLLGPKTSITPRSKPNEQLGLKAIKTLDALMDATSPPCWKLLLPGCFASLYRVLLEGGPRNQDSSSSLVVVTIRISPKMMAAATNLLCRMLTSTLGTQPRTKSKGEQNAASSAPSLFMNAVKKAGGSTTPQSNTSPFLSKASSSSKSMDMDEPFVLAVVERLPSPLIILLQRFTASALAAVNSGSQAIKTKLSTVRLCHCILVDTRYFWTSHKDAEKSKSVGDNSQSQRPNAPASGSTSIDNTSATDVENLERISLESCLSLLHDDASKVRQSAQDTLDQYFTYPSSKSGSATTLTQHISIAPHIVNLIEKLLATARSGREDDCLKQIAVIRGYLSLTTSLDSGHDNSGTSPRETHFEYLNHGASVRDALAFPVCSQALMSAMSGKLRAMIWQILLFSCAHRRTRSFLFSFISSGYRRRSSRSRS
jgi:hypothetical protein